MEPRPDKDHRGVNVVLGYGTFGRRATAFLHNTIGQDERILVIDKAQKHVPTAAVQFICADAVTWFTEHLDISRVRRIIPAVPIHFAAQWLSKKLYHNGWSVVPCPLSDALLAHLPHAVRVNQHSAIASHADFICPSNCPEPDDICSHTRQQRPPPLYQIFSDLQTETFSPLIVRSHQFAPGIGGYYPDALATILRSAMQAPNRQLLVGTACKCHGILDGMSITAR